uniref:AMP-binding_C domain-containing protein n=1 Tax=Rhabditophanes sp. KR3021 TaxID=114890 RepID=A0AC35U2U2_9BILA
MVIASNPVEGKRVGGTVGRAVDGVQLRINKDKVVEVRSNAMFGGYWKNPLKTKEEFTEDGFFITGDTGRLDENGYLQIMGRNKDLIISGGLNVYPKEVEDVIENIKNVLECAVISVPDPDLGEAVLAVVVATKAMNQHQIIKNCKDVLATYKVPKKVIFLDALPRNTMGKIQKNILRETYKNAIIL